MSLGSEYYMGKITHNLGAREAAAATSTTHSVNHLVLGSPLMGDIINRSKINNNNIMLIRQNGLKQVTSHFNLKK